MPKSEVETIKQGNEGLHARLDTTQADIDSIKISLETCTTEAKSITFKLNELENQVNCHDGCLTVLKVDVLYQKIDSCFKCDLCVFLILY